MNNASFDAPLPASVSLSRGRLWSSEVVMCTAAKNKRGVIELLRDPLIRLVMDSDGVTEQAMIATLEHLRIALAAREIMNGAHGDESGSLD
jgi:hypothetical protein